MKANEQQRYNDSSEQSSLVRLNKYIANAGVCSRRAADKLIEEGRVKVNGKLEKNLGTKVSLSDKVQVDNNLVTSGAKKYVIMNKPKNTICTRNDENNRKTVIDILPDNLKHLYPVGRLDRNTTGVLLLTNDGNLTQNLLHPSKKVKKIYKAKALKRLSQEDLDRLVQGVELEDGVSKFDKIVELNEDKEIRYGIEIHSGKNRVIRRMFEKVGNEVIKLDRVMFHSFDKRGLHKGQWRELKEKELKSLNVYLRTTK
ncbi:MAG: rRNA pseudouridine synthase [Bacteroidia bacterium]|nr:rRNA pseudouridine synthase [Bacteroidia bacterium]NNJ56724.1 rRNA pseudouridine synthase [Bacteroidia bacterium]